MKDSILDLLVDVAEIGNEVARGRAKAFDFNKNTMAAGWMNAMTGKRHNIFDMNQRDYDEVLEEDDDIDADDMDDEMESHYKEEKHLKKKQSVPRAKAKKMSKTKKAPKAKEINQLCKQKQPVNQSVEYRDIRNMDQIRLQEGIILSEILGPPVSKKRRNRMGRD